MGAPQGGGTWEDEAINKDLKKVMGAAHRTVFHRRVLVEFQQLQKPRA